MPGLDGSPDAGQERRRRNTAVSNRVSALQYLTLAVPLLLIGLAATAASLVVGAAPGKVGGGLLLVVAGAVTLRASRLHNAAMVRDGVPGYGRELVWFGAACLVALGGFYLLGR